jgi:hypothetical protein
MGGSLAEVLPVIPETRYPIISELNAGNVIRITVTGHNYRVCQGEAMCTDNPCECDLNHDGVCDILDWPLFIEDWGKTDRQAP